MDGGTVTEVQVHQGAGSRSTEVSLVLPADQEGLPRPGIILIIDVYVNCQGRLIFMPMGIRRQMCSCRQMCPRKLGGERHWITALKRVCAMLPERAPCSGLSQPPPAWSRERACLPAGPAPLLIQLPTVPLALSSPHAFSTATTISPFFLGHRHRLE